MRRVLALILAALPPRAHSASLNDRRMSGVSSASSHEDLTLPNFPVEPLLPPRPWRQHPPTRTQSMPTKLDHEPKEPLALARAQSLPRKFDEPDWWNHRLNRRLRIEDKARGNPREGQWALARLVRQPDIIQHTVASRLRAWVAQFADRPSRVPRQASAAYPVEELIAWALVSLKDGQEERRRRMSSEGRILNGVGGPGRGIRVSIIVLSTLHLRSLQPLFMPGAPRRLNADRSCFSGNLVSSRGSRLPTVT